MARTFSLSFHARPPRKWVLWIHLRRLIKRPIGSEFGSGWCGCVASPSDPEQHPKSQDPSDDGTGGKAR